LVADGFQLGRGVFEVAGLPGTTGRFQPLQEARDSDENTEAT
jgi:hypothetical protein